MYWEPGVFHPVAQKKPLKIVKPFLEHVTTLARPKTHEAG